MSTLRRKLFTGLCALCAGLALVAAGIYVATNFNAHFGNAWPSGGLAQGFDITFLATIALAALQLVTVVMLVRLSRRAKAPAPARALIPANDQFAPSGLPRTPQNVALELAVMSDSVQRFLVWMRAHGMTGEQSWTRLHLLYEEFCQMTDETPEDMRVLGKRLLQCGCEKPPMKQQMVNGKRVRKQFYIIPERHSEAAVTVARDERGYVDDSPGAIRLAA